MENSFLSNKIIIKYCKDYFKIINEKFSKNDNISSKVILIYQAYIFSINPKNKIELKKISLLNDAVKRYFDDREFRTHLSSIIKALRLPEDKNKIIKYFADTIIVSYKKYLDGYTRNLYIPKWI